MKDAIREPLMTMLLRSFRLALASRKLAFVLMVLISHPQATGNGSGSGGEQGFGPALVSVDLNSFLHHR
jgi:hypothetical protein